ncbi:MAG: integrase core domain-containing protein, partial [Eggerthellaceae bacterium]|nr:integrase core domain-containing protein [Eggerthellaceae bacterium]
PYDNAVVEATNRNLKSSEIFQRRYGSIQELRRQLNKYVWWYNNKRIHATLGYMSPVEFRQAGLSL